MRDETPVFGFTGPSGAGKTTLIEAVIRELVSRGLSVGVVKHASHRIEVDRPGKDSHRLYESGASAVALAGPDRLISFERRDGTPPALADSIAALPRGLDAVLVEGFLLEPVPRYVVLPAGGRDERGYRDAERVLRVIEVPPREDHEPPRYDPVLVKEIADEIARAASERGRG
jgi:molybdopterin-guanine dinucleotide biosynthesis protein B